MIIPAPKLFKIIKGATFDYRFQYFLGEPGSADPQDLTNYTARWALSNGAVILASYTTGASVGHSGVFFGGDTSDRTNGVIDLIITAADTSAITWTTAQHILTLTKPTGEVIPLLSGNIGVIGSLPS